MQYDHEPKPGGHTHITDVPPTYDSSDNNASYSNFYSNNYYGDHNDGHDYYPTRDFNHAPPVTENDFTATARGHGGNGPQKAQTTMPWWNPRYWRKRVWIAIGVVLVIIIVIAVAVGVTEAKKNAYPNYSELDYSLKDTFEGDSFFDNFDYFTGYDPTAGFVHYVPKEQAAQLSLTSTTADSATLKVDTSVGPNSVPNASTGRFSVRVTSRKTYNEGLFIFDVKHSPYGCGTWPALWLTDPYNWPQHGETDIMESVNQGTDGNQMTLHTTSGCSMSSVKRKQTGKTDKSNCDHSKDSNAGCGVDDDQSSFGKSFNDNGGGIMAVEWRDAGIRMWQFARDSIPKDITGGKPTPSSWGTASADFPSTDCNIGNHFKNQSIVANINLCGQLVEAVYDDSGCPSNCTDYVANNPEAFNNAFWEFGKFQVYQAS